MELQSGYSTPSVLPSHRSTLPHSRRLVVVVASASSSRPPPSPSSVQFRRRRTSPSLLELAPWPEGSCHIFWSIFWSFNLATAPRRSCLPIDRPFPIRAGWLSSSRRRRRRVRLRRRRRCSSAAVARRPHCWSWPRGLRDLVIFFGVYFGASIWLQHPVGSAFPSIDPSPFAPVGCRRRVGVVVASASVAVVGAVPRRRTSPSLLELAPWPEGSCHIFWSIFWSFSLALPSHRLTLFHPRRLVVVVTSALSVLTAICFSVCFGQCDTCFFPADCLSTLLVSVRLGFGADRLWLYKRALTPRQSPVET